MSKSTVRITSLALAAAAGLHLAAFPEHIAEGFLIASFFLVCAVLQLVAALMVRAGVGRRARQIIVLGNVAVIGLWLVSRTVGLPLGPDANVPEAISSLDALSFVAEIIAIGGLVRMGYKRRVPSRVWKAGPVAALALAMLFVAGAATAFAPQEHHHDEAAHHHTGAPSAVVAHTHTH
ncbi:MAG: hypothetical protein M3159_07150 [Actinomycetota bacterium]|nr:hypothetical protein [Actinomycetota bacterium]